MATPKSGSGRSSSLPAETVEYLKAWIVSPEHIHHPYPTEEEKVEIMSATGIELKRLNNWFVNNRIRFWKPRYEAFLRQQQRQGQAAQVGGESSSSAITGINAVSPKPSPVLIPRSSPSVSMMSDLTEAPVSLYCVSDSSSSSVTSGSTSDVEGESDDGLSSKRRRVSLGSISEAVAEPSTTEPSTGKRKNYIREKNQPETPRTKYQKKDEKLWKNACETSKSHSSEELPSLDEAALLFGFVNVA